MTNKEYKVGSVLKSSVGEFTKIISIKNGVYGLSGWTTLGNASKATVANLFVNGYGLEYAGVTVEKAGTDKATAPAKSAGTPTATASKPKPVAKAKPKPKAKAEPKAAAK